MGQFAERLEADWPLLEKALPAIFTTQEYVEALKQSAPATWEAITEKHGPGGRGSGNYYSPANIAFNFLRQLSERGSISRRQFAEASPGWGSKVVAQWERSTPPLEVQDFTHVDVSDLGAPPERVEVTIVRIVRDTKIAQAVKRAHECKCQICSETIELPDGKRYAEAHHVRPLGGVHKGPDKQGNVLCLCPNHHAQLDLGVIPIDLDTLRTAKGHQLEQVFADYHNEHIYLGK